MCLFGPISNVIPYNKLLYLTGNDHETVQSEGNNHHEKTGLRGFRPGATQIGLYSHRSRLDT